MISTKHLPRVPGVYIFKKSKKVLYVGKATSLRDRVQSYLSKDIGHTRGPLIVKMLSEATSVDFEVTDSVVEALIREAFLIKKYQPIYNTKEKSDKSFYYVVITKEDYPRVFTLRERELFTAKAGIYRSIYGPFPYATQLKTALVIVRKLFPFLSKTDLSKKDKRRVSQINEELGLAPAFSRGTVTQKEYLKNIRNIELFFDGKKKKLMTILTKEMKQYAKNQAFEHADSIKRQLFALQHINDVALIKNEVTHPRENKKTRIEAYDVAHLSLTSRVGVMVVFNNGEPNPSEYRKFIIQTTKKGDADALQEILMRRLEHTEWELPNIIVVDGNAIQGKTADTVIKKRGLSIPIVAVVKNVKHKPRGILGRSEIVREYKTVILKANAEAHRFAINYHRAKRRKMYL